MSHTIFFSVLCSVVVIASILCTNFPIALLGPGFLTSSFVLHQTPLVQLLAIRVFIRAIHS